MVSKKPKPEQFEVHEYNKNGKHTKKHVVIPFNSETVIIYGKYCLAQGFTIHRRDGTWTGHYQNEKESKLCLEKVNSFKKTRSSKSA